MPYRKSWNKLWRGFRRVCTLPLIVLVKFYQRCISPFTPASCRYTPTCSQYALEALRKYGPLKGTWLTLKRLSRCHPWGGSGYDPASRNPSGSQGSLFRLFPETGRSSIKFPSSSISIARTESRR